MFGGIGLMSLEQFTRIARFELLGVLFVFLFCNSMGRITIVAHTITLEKTLSDLRRMNGN